MSAPSTQISHSAEETFEELRSKFGDEFYPDQASIQGFEYKEDDLMEAVTHCASTLDALPFLSNTDVLVTPLAAQISAHIEPLAETVSAVTVPAETAPVETAPSDEPAPADKPAPIDDFSLVGSPTSSYIDFQRGWLQYGTDGALERPEDLQIKLEVDDETGQKYLTFVSSSDPGFDLRAAKFLEEDWSYDNNNPQYPAADLSGRPRFAFNCKYKYELHEDGSIIMQAPKLKFDKYNYAEHMFLGNDLHLTWTDGSIVKAADQVLELENKVELLYGQINGLGGDFFGGYKPICLGETDGDRRNLFLQAYGCLGKDTDRAPGEIERILKTRDEEVAAVKEAIETGQSTEKAYKKMATEAGFFGLKEEKDLQKITIGRPSWGDFQMPSYLRLAQLNLDHFGRDAHTAYNTGHHCAMEEAAKGNLQIAYAMNAFADHYLGDCFAAGHMRTPRRILHRAGALSSLMWVPPFTALLPAIAPDMCSKYMHDEDNFRGLQVSNRKGETWRAYGDKKLFEDSNKSNCERMRAALQASVDEVYACWKSRKVVETDANKYAAWEHAPTLDSVWGKQNHSPLFSRDGLIRKNIEDVETWEHEKISSWKPWIWVYNNLRGSDVMKQY